MLPELLELLPVVVVFAVLASWVLAALLAGFSVAAAPVVISGRRARRWTQVTRGDNAPWMERRRGMPAHLLAKAGAAAGNGGAAHNRNLNRAQVVRNDEFYTRITDIEKEMEHYAECFRGKVVLCNCDDPERSAFWRYFRGNYGALGLAGLMATHYVSPDDPDGGRLFAGKTVEPRHPHKVEFDGRREKRSRLRGNGDFSSEECLELMKRADIVATNPPFSLFRKYIGLLVRRRKKFLVIGNINALTHKVVRPLILRKRMWLGVNSRMKFDTKGGGEKAITSCWYTNLEHDRRNEALRLAVRYEDDPAAYPKYDNYDAIEVGAVSKIPMDYFGKMGVPLSFLLVHSKKQFRIVGLCLDVLDKSEGMFRIDGRRIYRRLVIQRVDGAK